MLSLVKFYSVKSNISRVVPIINGKSPISLRLIDWFVTNYAKKYNTIITHTIGNNVVHFNVYLSYRSQLKAYSKHLFDPFRRRDRITFVYDRTHSIETTIGQLNLFRFLLQNNMLDYIENNLDSIESDMIHCQKETGQHSRRIHKEKEQTPKNRKKRTELSRSSMKNMNMFDGQRRLQFD